MKAKSNRPPMQSKPFRLVSDEVRQRAIQMLRNVPIDTLRPLEVVIREETKRRKPDANAAMWAGPLKDLSEQAWLEGHQYSAEVWHHWAKKEFLPDEFDPELCMDGYQKWAIDPAGDRVLIGSTTELTVKGMSEYMEQLIAFGANLDVKFSIKEQV